MRFLDLKNELKDFIVFSVNDILKIDPDFHHQRLSEWQRKGYITKLIKEYYVFSDMEVSEPALFVIANEIYDPSYISLESAFSYYNLIPEGVYSVTSVSSRPTRRYEAEKGVFDYRKIRRELMFGYLLVDYGKRRFKMASKEKALLDYLYLNSDINSKADFDELRLNAQEFKSGFDIAKARKYLEFFENKELEERFSKFIKYLEYA